MELGDFLIGKNRALTHTQRNFKFFKKNFQVPTNPTYLNVFFLYKRIVLKPRAAVPPTPQTPQEHDSHGVVATGWPGPPTGGQQVKSAGEAVVVVVLALPVLSRAFVSSSSSSSSSLSHSHTHSPSLSRTGADRFRACKSNHTLSLQFCKDRAEEENKNKNKKQQKLCKIDICTKIHSLSPKISHPQSALVVFFFFFSFLLLLWLLQPISSPPFVSCISFHVFSSACFIYEMRELA